MFGVNPYIGSQVESMVILLGVFFAVTIWLYFQRHRAE